jgi:hypothetical protein
VVLAEEIEQCIVYCFVMMFSLNINAGVDIQKKIGQTRYQSPGGLQLVKPHNGRKVRLVDKLFPTLMN